MNLVKMTPKLMINDDMLQACFILSLSQFSVVVVVCLSEKKRRESERKCVMSS